MYSKVSGKEWVTYYLSNPLPPSPSPFPLPFLPRPARTICTGPCLMPCGKQEQKWVPGSRLQGWPALTRYILVVLHTTYYVHSSMHRIQVRIIVVLGYLCTCKPQAPIQPQPPCPPGCFVGSNGKVQNLTLSLLSVQLGFHWLPFPLMCAQPPVSCRATLVSSALGRVESLGLGGIRWRPSDQDVPVFFLVHSMMCPQAKRQHAVWPGFYAVSTGADLDSRLFVSLRPRMGSDERIIVLLIRANQQQTKSL